MAIISCLELMPDRSGSTDEQNVVTLNRAWLVKTDNPNDGIVAVSTWFNANVANLYSPYPGYPLAIARNINITPQEDECIWKVSRTYSTAQLQLTGGGPAATGGLPDGSLSATSPTPPSSGTNQGTPAPDRTPQFRYARIENKEAIRDDNFNKPLKNTAGDPFEGVQIDKPHLAITIKYWSLHVSVAHILNVFNKINLTTWKGFLPQTLLVKDFSVSPKYDYIGDVDDTLPALPKIKVYGLVWECDVQLEYNPDTWQLSLENVGRRQLVSRTVGGTVIKEKQKIVGADGSALDHPALLNPDGTLWNGTGTAPSPLKFDIYTEFEFSGLLI